MATEILMPALSPTMESGTLAKWIVKTGDSVESGDILAEIETDKATMELEAPEEGVIQQLLVADGAQDIAVNTPIALLVSENGIEAPHPTAPAPKQNRAPDIGAVNLAGATVAPIARETEIPEGTELKHQSVREALRDAMAEEMRRDSTVFLMGGGSRRVSGSVQGVAGAS